MEIELVRGTQRRKHVAGVLVGDRLRVSFPRWMPLEQAREIADELRQRMERRVARERIDLERRAHDLARRHDLPIAESVVWAENQAERWGSCSPEARSIRVSSRLAAFPDWVLDYVLVHELAHLAEPNHGPAFHDIVARYALAERARGFLIAKDLDPEREV
ncbi:MAG: M48 family metallopeptidase [Acidimicrobiia bacterium]|nr:M48 family metallopeptidase [Acidimicrobiia bacterium]